MENKVPSQEEFLAEMATTSLNMAEMDALVIESQDLWADYEAKKKISSAALVKYEECEARILKALADAGKKSYKVDGVGTVTAASRLSVSMPKEIQEKRKLFKFIEQVDQTLLYNLLTINHQSLNSWFKQKTAELIEKKQPTQIPGLALPTAQPFMQFRKAAKGANNG